MFIQLPSAFPPPCPYLSEVARRARWQFCTVPGVSSPKNLQKQNVMLAFFRIFFRRPLAFRVSKKLRNLLNKLPKISKKGGLGWLWGLWVEPLEAFGPPDGPKLKKRLKKANHYLPPWGPVGHQNLIKMKSGSICCRFSAGIFSSFHFSTILGDFRLRNLCLFGVADMAKV